MKILVTGAAGFIGFNIARRLLGDGYKVIGLDNVNNYYDVNLKRDRLKILQDFDSFSFYENNLEDKEAVEHLFKKEDIQRVIDLEPSLNEANRVVTYHATRETEHRAAKRSDESRGRRDGRKSRHHAGDDADQTWSAEFAPLNHDPHQ